MAEVYENDGDAVGLAQALMAHITGRLEDLAAIACDSQLSRSPPEGLIDGIRSVLALAEAHRELLRSSAAEQGP